MTLRTLYMSVYMSVSMIALAACAAKSPPPQAIIYDPGSFKPAMVVSEAPTVEASPEEPSPPPALAKSETRPPTARVLAANRAALQEPTTDGFNKAVQVYQFIDGAIYRLYTAPENISDILLQPGETLISVSAGDTERWIVDATPSGSGNSRRDHIIVKPKAADLKTNLVIITDRRSYHLQLDSTEQIAMAMVSWTYPQDEIAAKRRRVEEAKQREAAEFKVDTDNVKFRYEITGDTPPWRPVRAFDDTSKVYIEFPGRIDQGEAPPLFVVGQDGGRELVNYRVRANYYIVDRLFAAAELRLGLKPQQVVRISRTDVVASR